MVNSSLFRRIQLQLLMNLTAHALGVRSVRLWTRSNAEALKVYAEFTAQHLQAGADDALLQRMNSEALKTGRLLRQLFFVHSTSRAQRLIVALYRNIGIQLSFAADGHLCFHRCYFSSHYTPAACRAASMLDDGIICGIMHHPARSLCFSQRITEGCPCCKASLQYTTQNT
jgi:hypothetical protein